jgi:hypothetical protein
VLWSFAFAQPLLDLLGDAPEFFVARGNTRGDIVLLALGLTVVPPLLLTLLEGAVGLVSRRARHGLHLGLVALFVAAFVLQLINDASVRSAVLLAVAVAVGCLGAAFYARTAAGPAILTVLSPAPLLFLILFLVVSPVSKLVLPGDEARAASVKVPSKAPVVVILFDEFAGWTLMGPDGRIDAERYPNFARLAGHATWYRNATTVADYTERAVPALLTGDRPDKSALPIASDHPESLFTLLGGHYRFDVTEPVTDICPTRLCPEENASRPSQAHRLKELGSDLSLVSLHLLLPPSLRSGLKPVDRSFGDFRAQEAGPQSGQPAAGHTPEQGLAALAAVIDRTKIFDAFEQRLGNTPQRSSLVFFHIQMPHNPYHYLPSGQRYPETIDQLPGVDTVDQPAGGRWRDDPRLTRQGLQRYLLQIGDTDRLLGRLVDRMKASGLYDKALLVVAADHGASFLPGHPLRAADSVDLPSIASIPLFVKSPGQRDGGPDDANVEITDVLPTLAKGLGVKLPWGTDGQPADRASNGGEIRLQPQYGDSDLTMPFAEYLRRRDRLVRSMLDAFGTKPAGIYSGGPDADLVGRAVSDLNPGALPGASFELDGGGLLADVDPKAAIVPSFLTGELSGVPAGARVAVAVDGRVAAGAAHWRDGDITRFSAIVPTTAYARGPNSVDLLVIRGGAVALLPGAQLGYRLTDGAIVDGAGKRIPIVAGSGGKIDSLNVGQTDVTIKGTAGAADRVIAFAGPRLLATGRPAASAFKLSGWAAGPTPGSAPAPVRVFAIDGRRARELPKPKPPSFPSSQ